MRWRQQFWRPGRARVPGGGQDTSFAARPDRVDPGELALLLLQNALRLLDEAMAPPEVSSGVREAIRELEEDLSGRSG